MPRGKLTLDEVVNPLPPPVSWGVQHERPQEVGGVLEVGSIKEDLRGIMSEQIILHIKSVSLQSSVVRKD